MCSAGPRPSFGCISHSFAGPETSPPHLRHFTKRLSPRLGRQSVCWTWERNKLDGQATWVWLGVWHFRVHAIPMSNLADCHGRGYTFDGILMFHLWYINIPQYQKCPQNLTGGRELNGESKRSFAVAIASFAIGAVLAGVLGNPKTRARITEGSRSLAKKTKRLAKRTDLA
jgi:hypothetical protein